MIYPVIFILQLLEHLISCLPQQYTEFSYIKTCFYFVNCIISIATLGLYLNTLHISSVFAANPPEFSVNQINFLHDTIEQPHRLKEYTIFLIFRDFIKSINFESLISKLNVFPFSNLKSSWSCLDNDRHIKNYSNAEW